MKALAGASRGNTFKQRVSAWEAYAKWLWAARGRVWPESPADYIDYVQMQVTVPAPSSWPGTFLSTVMWLEARTIAPPESGSGGAGPSNGALIGRGWNSPQKGSRRRRPFGSSRA